MRTLLVAFAVVAALVLPGRAAAQMSDQDTRLAEKVAESILNYSHFTIFDDVSVGVDNRVVTLEGRVTQPKKKDDIGALVAKIDGVRSVKNLIGVLPNSPTDDNLRMRVAKAIYDHPAFWSIGQLANPPIHIIVEGGNVTLTGVVDSETQKALAFSLAQVGGQMGVTNRLRVSRR